MTQLVLLLVLVVWPVLLGASYAAVRWSRCVPTKLMVLGSGIAAVAGILDAAINYQWWFLGAPERGSDMLWLIFVGHSGRLLFAFAVANLFVRLSRNGTYLQDPKQER